MCRSGEHWYAATYLLVPSQDLSLLTGGGGGGGDTAHGGKLESPRNITWCFEDPSETVSHTWAITLP